VGENRRCVLSDRIDLSTDLFAIYRALQLVPALSILSIDLKAVGTQLERPLIVRRAEHMQISIRTSPGIAVGGCSTLAFETRFISDRLSILAA